MELIFIASEYYATGEGRTVSILITRAIPSDSHYYIKPEWVKTPEGWKYKEGVMNCTREQIALEEFKKTFDVWTAIGAEVLSQEEFVKRFSYQLPPMVINYISDPEGNFRYHSQLHLNLS